MKKIINKKTYDTEKATFIGEWDNGESPTDCLDYIQEQLYMTADHEFFIHGRGGARTAYGRYVGFDSWAGGQKIRLLADSTARRVVRKHLPEKYHELFGEKLCSLPGCPDPENLCCRGGMGEDRSHRRIPLYPGIRRHEPAPPSSDEENLDDADPDGKSGCPGMAERMLRTAEKKKIQIDF